MPAPAILERRRPAARHARAVPFPAPNANQPPVDRRGLVLFFGTGQSANTPPVAANPPRACAMWRGGGARLQLAFSGREGPKPRMAPTPERAGSEPRRQYHALCVPADGILPSPCAMTPATASTCWSVRGPVSRSSARIAHSVAHNARSCAYTPVCGVLRGYRPNPTQRALEGLPQGRNDVRNG